MFTWPLVDAIHDATFNLFLDTSNLTRAWETCPRFSLWFCGWSAFLPQLFISFTYHRDLVHIHSNPQNGSHTSNALLYYFMSHWRMAMTLTDDWNHFIVWQTNSEAPFLGSLVQLETLCFMCIAYQCMPVVAQVHAV